MCTTFHDAIHHPTSKTRWTNRLAKPIVSDLFCSAVVDGRLSRTPEYNHFACWKESYTLYPYVGWSLLVGGTLQVDALGTSVALLSLQTLT